MHADADNSPANTTSTSDSPPAAASAPAKDVAIFAGGCFWGVEHAYQQVPGVIEAVSGYIGGEVSDPNYRQVCTDTTGHAEAVRVTYDPAKISYRELVDIFWRVHDPTTVNRQGPDYGSQYRSAIFFNNPDQERIARESVIALEESKRFGKRSIVTQINPASTFWPAEEYHQEYLDKHPNVTCHVDFGFLDELKQNK